MQRFKSHTSRLIRRSAHSFLRITGALLVYITITLGITLAAIAIALVILRNNPITLPRWVITEIEAHANDFFHERSQPISVSFRSAALIFGKGWSPDIQLHDLHLNIEGNAQITLDHLRFALDGDTLWAKRKINPREIYINGGSLRIGDQTHAPQVSPITGLPDFFVMLEQVIAAPALAQLQMVRAENIRIARHRDTGWPITGGQIIIQNTAANLEAQAQITYNGYEQTTGPTPARARIAIGFPKGQNNLTLSASISAFKASDLAREVPVLAWLSVIDAPLSGALDTTMSLGGVSTLNADLSLGRGGIKLAEDAPQATLESADLKISYNAETGRINVENAQISSTILRVKAQASGYAIDAQGAYIKGCLADKTPQAFGGDIHFENVAIDPEGLFDSPITFISGQAKTRIKLAPFGLEISQMRLQDSHARTTTIDSDISIDNNGISGYADMHIDAMLQDRILKIWPKKIAPSAREWSLKNIRSGLLSDIHARIDFTPKQAADVSLSFNFKGAQFTILPDFPAIKNASGHAKLRGKHFDILLEKGTMSSPIGGDIRIRNGHFSVSDLTQKPPHARVDFTANSSITAALSAINAPPLKLLRNTALTPDVTAGAAEISGWLDFSLAPQKTTPKPAPLTFEISAQLTDISTRTLVPNHLLTSEKLSLTLTQKKLQIAGKSILSGQAFTGLYTQEFSRNACPKSAILAQAKLSQATLTAFNVTIPNMKLTGETPADVKVTLGKCSAPSIEISSNIKGIELEYPPLSLKKPAQMQGHFKAVINMEKPVELPYLTLRFDGASLEAALKLDSGNRLKSADFSKLVIGDWYNGAAQIRKQDSDKYDLFLTSGHIDLRKKPLVGVTDYKKTQLKIFADLTRITISDRLYLSQFNGQFSQDLTGRFRAKVNDGALISGRTFPSDNGYAIEIKSNDAGATLASSGVFDYARGGKLTLYMAPTTAEQTYESRITLENFRVKNASILAELLSLSSGVGLLEQLNGNGISFTKSSADMIISPAGIDIKRGNAVGASLGVSLAGRYDSNKETVDFEGVLSPLYLLNGITSAFMQNGEGVFGVIYNIKGAAAAPKTSVNLLSLFTPGFLRNIFRSPPKPDEQSIQ